MRRDMIIIAVALLVGALGVPSSGVADLDSGLVGYWSFDEEGGDTAFDYSEYANHGIIFGAIDTVGILGRGLYFDGEEDYVDCGNNEIFDMEYPVTLTAWIYKVPGGGVEGQGNGGIIITDRTSGLYSGYILETMHLSEEHYPVSVGFGDGTDGGHPRFRRSKGSPAIIRHNTWYHVAGVVWGPLDMSIYVNGVDVGGSYSGSGDDVAWRGGPCVIGVGWGSYDYYFKGIIDEVRVYDRGLSEAEIDSLYFRGAQHPPVAYIDSIYPNPVEAGDEVFFSGHGEDANGLVVGYGWWSSIDGYLSSDSSFSISTLSAGTHTIFFGVKDDDDWWSIEASAILEVIGGTIAGTVISSETSPVEGVHVVVLNTSVDDTTDINGEFSLEGLNPDTYDVFFTHRLHYDTTVAGVTVTGGDTTIMNVSLRHSEGPFFVRGDAEADGDHDIFDALRIIYWIGGDADAPPCQIAADASDYGGVNMYDAFKIIFWLSGGTSAPSAPCCDIPADCGFDRTPDDPPLSCESYPPCGWNPKTVAKTFFVGAAEASRLVVEEGGIKDVGDGAMVVPVTLTNAEPLIGFNFTIEYDAQLITAKVVDNTGLVTEGFDVFVGGTNEPGTVKVFAVSDMEIADGVNKLPVGKHQVARVVFELTEPLHRDIALELTEGVMAIGHDRALNHRLMDGVIAPTRPQEFRLFQNYPNPFNPLTEIEYALPTNSEVTLEVYNLLGQKVITLVDEHQDAGYKAVRWDSRIVGGGEVSSGVYFYRLQAGAFRATRKMILLR